MHIAKMQCKQLRRCRLHSNCPRWQPQQGDLTIRAKQERVQLAGGVLQLQPQRVHPALLGGGACAGGEQASTASAWSSWPSC